MLNALLKFKLLTIMLVVGASALVLAACASSSSTPAVLKASSESLSPAQLYERVAPSLAYIETDEGSGSGVLLEGGYILTTARVTWQSEYVVVKFPDKSVYEDVKVLGVDFVKNLAVLGPIDTAASGLPLLDDEDFVYGSPVYLIDYPIEMDEFPTPVITSGVLSRIREYESTSTTFIQSDNLIPIGRSGGGLFDEYGNVIGITGYNRTLNAFSISLSSSDALADLDELKQGRDAFGIGVRSTTDGSKVTSFTKTLANDWDSLAVFFNEPVGTTIEVQAESDGNITLDAMEHGAVIGQSCAPAGARFFSIQELGGGTSTQQETVFTVNTKTPYVALIQPPERTGAAGRSITLSSSHGFSVYQDPDDGRQLEIGKHYVGYIDHICDADYYTVAVLAGQKIEIFATSLLTDVSLTVPEIETPEVEVIGGGLFLSDKTVEYVSDTDRIITVVVSPDLFAERGGGYTLMVREIAEGS